MNRGPNAFRSRPQLVLFIVVPLLALVSFMSWGLSSPVGSSPDDDFHLASIWCGHGDNAGCESTGDGGRKAVYRDLAIDSVCYAFNADASAACQGTDFGDNPNELLTTGRGNFTGLYPPVFYFTMSLFTSPDIESAVLVMKLVNSLLFVGLVGALFWLLPVHRRQTLMWSLAVTLVPLGMFIVPSTNPSGWAVLSAGTLWISLLGFFEGSGAKRIGLGVIAALATVIGAGARADSALYAGLAIALVLFLTFRRERAYFRSAAFALALLAVAIVLFFTANQSAAITSGLAEDPNVHVDPIVLAMANLINLPDLWIGIFGSRNLGWLDTVIPASVWVAGFACFAGAVFLGLAARIPRKGIAVAIIVAALVVVPTVLLVQSQSTVGANVQPRYLLPLMVMLAGFVLLQTPDARIRVTRLQMWIVVVAITLANSIALFTDIRRYVTGADVTSLNLDAGVEWWWNLPFSPMTVWIVGSLAFAGVLVAINTRTWNRESLPAVVPA